MLTKDLFSTKFERELHEGAIDNLEARYIDDLNRKMDDLLARARQATDPQHKAALKREYEQVKSTRSGYFGTNKSANLDEGSMKHMLHDLADRMERDQFIDYTSTEMGMDAEEMGQFWDDINGPMDEAGIGQDIVNRTEKMARATPQTPAGKVVSTVKNAAKWVAGKGGPGREGPTYEGAEDIVDRGEYDREGDMAKDNIHTIVRNARELESILGDDDNLPEWVQDKLANIKGMMTAVSEYMQTQNERNYSDIQKKSFEKVAEGGQDFNKVEPYAVCLAGRPVKKFDYYEEARRFHDNWKQKLYREGDRAKADKITLMPLNLDEQGVAEAETDYSKRRQRERDLDEEQKPYNPNEFRPVGPITIVPPRKLKSGETHQGINDYWKAQGQAPIYKTNEAGSPAQQAAIAIAMKRAGKKPKSVDEDQNNSGVESAIIRRIMVAHTDLLMKFGPDKVMQAAEEVAYNVGDVDEIGTSDISAYVAQVKQILGATP